METRYIYIQRYCLAITDIVLVNYCYLLAYQLTFGHSQMVFSQNLKFELISNSLIWFICSYIYQLYSETTLQTLEAVYKATFKSYSLHIVLFLGFLFFSDQVYFPRELVVFFYLVLIIGFLISRFIGTCLIDVLTKNYDLRKSVAVLGRNNGGLKLADYLGKNSSLKFVGFLDKGFSLHGTPADTPISSAKEQLKQAVQSGVEEVYVSVKPDEIANINELIQEGEKHCIRLKFVPDMSSLESIFRFDKMGNFTVLCARKESLEKIGNRVKKRLFDILVSLCVIVFIFSWLYPILALIIKFQSPGPVIFAQLRSGRDNKPFWCYKFRSMRMNAESDERQASIDDERITPIGRFMRSTSLDEFPQFFNVLLGYMTIVGPRPHMLLHTDHYSKLIDKYMVRQFLKPGITGWAQINGYRGETKDTSLMEKRVEHDMWYMDNWSLMLDLKIVFLTIINIFKGQPTAY